MEYNFKLIEKKWRDQWKKDEVYKVSNDPSKPKAYVLDMFPYPSGAGLHVGHPLGYIASDIYARYKRLKGFNVLHPIGFDAFGLPAEQFAIETGQHPAITTQRNIQSFKEQLNNLGFSYDWSREVVTSDPSYYKWTQWIFIQIYESWFNRGEQKAEHISSLIKIFENSGNKDHESPGDKELRFTANEWQDFDIAKKEEVLMTYRLAYLAFTDVNWCEALGTVLANDEVINGRSYRGGFPVVKKKMRQWSLRITEYAERLLKGLDEIDFSESMKEIQRNWIGKSQGAEIDFLIKSDLTPSPSPKENDVSAKNDLTPGPSPKENDVSAKNDLTPGPSPKERGNDSSQDYRYLTNNLDEWKYLVEFAKANRENSTKEEEIVWQALRNRLLDGFKFRRQHPIAGYIPDFVCLEKKIVVEIDGEYHDKDDQKKFDEARAFHLEFHGYRLLRFSNTEVINNISKVLESIQRSLNELPSPLLRRGVGGEVEENIIKVYTTRPDTIFGVDFMVLAPEHELVDKITTEEQRQSINAYKEYVQSRSEVDRMAEVKKITGCFTGAYAINPLNGREIPVWISEYVLIGYGTGAIMAVPSGDQRDFLFARFFDIPITNIIGDYFNGEEANPTKDAILQNSDFISGMPMRQAIDVVCEELEKRGIGKRKINYKMRDAGWSRQRYWGEPFPVRYKDEIPYPLPKDELPLELPPLDDFKPSGTGEGPLANVKDWVNRGFDTNTMPTHAGAAWYFLRYTDSKNDKEFAAKTALDYWGQVDVYIGGSEHAVAHLLYARLWIKVLHDLGYLNFDEPFKKLINQGKITGDSRFVYRIKGTQTFVSAGLKDQHETDPLHVDVNIVNGFDLDIEAFMKWKPDFSNSEFMLEDGSFYSEVKEKKDRARYLTGSAIEKMSKSYYNVVNPDTIVEKYGADTFRMYEMFLGPIEMSKPWDTKGIEGVHRFLKKLWRLFYDEQKGAVWNNEPANESELKVLHKAIRKIEDDIERFSFNTSVSAFMVLVNDLQDLKSSKKEILEPLLIMLSPFAPHIAEELWAALGNSKTILNAPFPTYNESYLVESVKEYPVSINGKLRTQINIKLDAAQPEVEEIILKNDVVKKWLEGKAPKKIIYVKGKMVNVVV